MQKAEQTIMQKMHLAEINFKQNQIVRLQKNAVKNTRKEKVQYKYERARSINNASRNIYLHCVYAV